MADSFINDRLRQRDENNRAFDSVRGRSGLAGLQRAFTGEDRAAFDKAKEATDQQRQREAMDFKWSEQQRKTDAAEGRAKVAEERTSIADANSKLMADRVAVQKEINLNSQILQQHKELAKDRAINARLKAGNAYYEKTAKLNPQAPDFQEKYGSVMGEVYGQLVDSEGNLPQDVKDHSNHLWSQHNAWSAVQTKPVPAGEKIVTTDKDGNLKTTIRQPLQPGEGDAAAQKARADLQAEHDLADLKLKSDTGPLGGAKQQNIDAVNKLKAKLGYALLDSSGRPLPSTPAPTPAVPTATGPVTDAASPAPVSLKPLDDEVAKTARAAIAAGKDAAAVAKRLQDNGYDPSGL